jgi:hypothetical protein
MAQGGIPLGQFSGSDATDRLRAVIEENQKATKWQTAIMVWLTWVMTALTVITTALTAVQAAPLVAPIWRAIHSWAGG